MRQPDSRKSRAVVLALGLVAMGLAMAVFRDTQAQRTGSSASGDDPAGEQDRAAMEYSPVVRDGALVRRGMPRFEEFGDVDLEALRAYLRAEAAKAREPARQAAREPLTQQVQSGLGF